MSTLFFRSPDDGDYHPLLQNKHLLKKGLGAGSSHSPVSVVNIGWVITCIKVDLGVCLMLRSLVCLILHGHLAAQFPYLTEKFLYYLSVLPHRMNQDVLHCLVPSLGQGHMEVYLWGHDT